MDNTASRNELIRRLASDEILTEAVQQAVYAALARHKQAGTPIGPWQDGKVVWIAPEDIELPGLEASQDIVA